MTPWTTACQASLSITNSWSLLKHISIKSVMPSNHLILYRPFLLLPSIFPSIRVFLNESALCIRWLEYWSFSFSISPSNELNLLLLGNILFAKYVLSRSVVSLLHDIYVLNKIFLIKIFREPSTFSAFERCIKTLI